MPVCQGPVPRRRSGRDRGYAESPSDPAQAGAVCRRAAPRQCPGLTIRPCRQTCAPDIVVAAHSFVRAEGLCFVEYLCEGRFLCAIHTTFPFRATGSLLACIGGSTGEAVATQDPRVKLAQEFTLQIWIAPLVLPELGHLDFRTEDRFLPLVSRR